MSPITVGESRSIVSRWTCWTCNAVELHCGTGASAEPTNAERKSHTQINPMMKHGVKMKNEKMVGKHGAQRLIPGDLSKWCSEPQQFHFGSGIFASRLSPQIETFSAVLACFFLRPSWQVHWPGSLYNILYLDIQAQFYLGDSGGFMGLPE